MVVVEQAKAIAMKLTNPNRVLDTIPTAKLMTIKGTEIVVTPHKLDEVRVLRNLGIKALHPNLLP